MKLLNKKTGGLATLVENEDCLTLKTDAGFHHYFSLAQLNEEWEDYEEPKEWWYIDIHGPHKVTNNDEYYQQVKAASKEIGNYFDTQEEAEKAVEKLKAWKRLKDKGFRFTQWRYRYDQPRVKNHSYYNFIAICEDGEVYEDLDLLFGGEE